MEKTAIGKILKGVGGLYTVRLLSNANVPAGNIISCRARGVFRHEHISPLPGDIVTLTYPEDPSDHEKYGLVIDQLQPRSNVLIRPPLANLDILFVTMAAAAPTPILSTVDKLIAIAEFNGIEPILVITKEELNPAYAEFLSHLYRTCGFSVFATSTVTGNGIASLQALIQNDFNQKTAAFAGASGIGKSTLMNRLFPSLHLSTSEISHKIERGKHTTRQVELFPLSDDIHCGYLADTPGFSMLDFERFDFFEKEDLPATMREFAPYIGSCKYTKCTHTKEEGCAILEAVQKGKIPLSRHESYQAIYQTLKAKKKWN